MKIECRIYFSIFIVVAILFIFAACKNKEDKMNTAEKFFQEFVADDSKALSDILTKEYELEELKNFFCENLANEEVGFGNGEDVSELTISIVDRRFPIEVIRTNGYTVYRVKGGGYFYVFWVKPLESYYNKDMHYTIGEPTVYFATYISSLPDASEFEILQKGVSTAVDVAEIDESFELSFVNSSGIYSYSLLDNDNIMEIEYTSSAEINDKSDLIVKNMTIFRREGLPSRLATVLLKDLPQ